MIKVPIRRHQRQIKRSSGRGNPKVVFAHIDDMDINANPNFPDINTLREELATAFATSIPSPNDRNPTLAAIKRDRKVMVLNKLHQLAAYVE